MIEVREINEQHREAALALRVKPGQEYLVSSVAEALRDAQQYGDVAWPRIVLDAGVPVGFVMGGFAEEEPSRSLVWKLLIDERHQGKGYARAAVEAVAEEARRRGRYSLGAFFHPGPDSSEGFWVRCGFVIQDPDRRPEVLAIRNL
jgi:diamine N-acetyltransferase